MDIPAPSRRSALGVLYRVRNKLKVPRLRPAFFGAVDRSLCMRRKLKVALYRQECDSSTDGVVNSDSVTFEMSCSVPTSGVHDQSKRSGPKFTVSYLVLPRDQVSQYRPLQTKHLDF